MATPSPQPSFGSVELRGGNARVVLIPALGGKISVLWFGERQWLWRNAQLPFRAPVAGASYVLTADSGGFDECFPTVGACTLPSLVRAAGGRELPDHGELWSQQPAMQLTTSADGHRAHIVWLEVRLPYRFERVLVVTPDGEVRCDYAVTNLGEQKFPFIWSAHPLLPLGRETRIELPEAARVRVWAQHGIDLGGPGAEHRWPRLRPSRRRSRARRAGRPCSSSPGATDRGRAGASHCRQEAWPLAGSARYGSETGQC